MFALLLLLYSLFSALSRTLLFSLFNRRWLVLVGLHFINFRRVQFGCISLFDVPITVILNTLFLLFDFLLPLFFFSSRLLVNLAHHGNANILRVILDNVRTFQIDLLKFPKRLFRGAEARIYTLDGRVVFLFLLPLF